MSLNRVFRYLGGLIIATLILGFGLPLAGIAPSKFLPPPMVYNTAQGKAHGVIISKDVSPTANPFKVGDHIYLVKYAFRAPPPLGRGETKPGKTERYYGEVRVPDETTYNALMPDDPISAIKYETTNPDINGIDAPNGGRSIGAGSNILSGWLIFLALDLALAFGIMMVVLERFGAKENI